MITEYRILEKGSQEVVWFYPQRKWFFGLLWTSFTYKEILQSKNQNGLHIQVAKYRSYSEAVINLEGFRSKLKKQGLDKATSYSRVHKID